MTVAQIKQNVLFINNYEEAEAFRKVIMCDDKDKVVQKVWEVIMADPEHVQNGWDLKIIHLNKKE